MLPVISLTDGTGSRRSLRAFPTGSGLLVKQALGLVLSQRLGGEGGTYLVDFCSDH